VALVVAIWGGILFTGSVASTLSFLQDEAVRRMVAFLIVFLILHQGIQFAAGVLGYAAMGVPAFRLTVEQTILLSKLSAFAGSLVAAFGGKGLF